MHARHILSGLTVLAVSSCATSAERVRESLATTPDWFEERRAELAGTEDYPDLASAPGSADVDFSDEDWAKIQSDLDEARRSLESHERGEPGEVDPNLEAWVEEKRAEVARGEAPY